jgi:hypothetical protein
MLSGSMVDREHAAACALRRVRLDCIRAQMSALLFALARTRACIHELRYALACLRVSDGVRVQVCVCVGSACDIMHSRACVYCMSLSTIMTPWLLACMPAGLQVCVHECCTMLTCQRFAHMQASSCMPHASSFVAKFKYDCARCGDETW